MQVLRLIALVLVLSALRSDPASAISGGHPAVGQEYGFVRYLFITWPGGQGGGCTGSVIDERHILTAAHCVMTEDGRPAISIEARLRRNASGVFPATAALVHRGYERKLAGGDLLFLRNDLAVLEMRDPMPPPYGQTPFSYIWQKGKMGGLNRVPPPPARAAENARSILDDILSRDEGGHPYAVQVGFGRFACDGRTNECSKTGSAKPKYILKQIYNFRTDRGIIPSACDPSPFTLSAPENNLICSSQNAGSTVSPTDSGPDGVYGAQSGDSGGPAIAFDKDMHPFILGVMSFGGVSTVSVNQNLVEHFDFLHDTEFGTGSSFVRYELQP